MDDKRFTSQYAYNIRHIYGQEGKRVDLPPFSCMKLILSTQSSNEYHGCPFASMKKIELEQFLIKKIDNLVQLNICKSTPATIQNSINEILNFQQNHCYQIACTSLFKLSYNTDESKVIRNPNIYFSNALSIISPNNNSLPCIEAKQITPKKLLVKKVVNTPSKLHSTIRTPYKRLYGSNTNNITDDSNRTNV